MFNASVVKLVDTRDLKSLGRNAVPVRVRPLVPILVWLSQGKKRAYIFSAIAQLVEQVTVNHWVAGSSPARGAI